MNARRRYHYEWAAYTDNLDYGRVLIIKHRNRDYVYLTACCAHKGVFIVRKERVYDN